VDFNKDGTVDFCRIVGGPPQPFYWACTLHSTDGARNFIFDVISDPGYPMTRKFIDWDGNGYTDSAAWLAPT
jgi:hypothetical protein